MQNNFQRRLLSESTKNVHLELGGAQFLAFGIDQGDRKEFVLPDEDDVIICFWVKFVGSIRWLRGISARMESESEWLQK